MIVVPPSPPPEIATIAVCHGPTPLKLALLPPLFVISALVTLEVPVKLAVPPLKFHTPLKFKAPPRLAVPPLTFKLPAPEIKELEVPVNVPPDGLNVAPEATLIVA